MNIVNLHIGKLNLCYVTYIYNGRREREKERGERERRREKGRERRRENSLQNHVIYNKMRIALCFTRQFFPCVDLPAPALLVFLRESPAGDMWRYVAHVYHEEMFSLIGNQRLRADCQAHICMYKRERGRERVSPLHFIRAPPCCAVGRFISRRPR